jgi:quinol-cytochrome oxidoreductase complex cytochrome b subunit
MKAPNTRKKRYPDRVTLHADARKADTSKVLRKKLQVLGISFAGVVTVLGDQIHKHVVRKHRRRKEGIVILEAFTIFHVVLSLAGIISGIVSAYFGATPVATSNSPLASK